jgi:hypothetical protein
MEDDRDPDFGYTRLYRWEQDVFVGVRVEQSVSEFEEEALGALADDGILWYEYAYERAGEHLVESRSWGEDPALGLDRTRYLRQGERSLGYDSYTSYDGGEETLTYSVRYEYDSGDFPTRALHETPDGTVTVHEIQILCE